MPESILVQKRVLCLGGSLRDGSLTTATLYQIERLVKAAGFGADVFSVAELPDMFVPGSTQATDPAVARLGELVARAASVFVGTPIYGGTPSGAVKNLLDTLHLFKDGAVGPFAGKRVVVGSVGGGALSGHYDPQPTAAYTLEIACANLGAWVSPRHVELSELAFDRDGLLVEPYAADLVRRAVLELTLDGGRHND